MATLLQLRAEPYWAREVVTPELDWLGDELCRLTGRPRVAAGTKGDVNHLRGAHRSQEWLRLSRYCVNRSYTVQPGLTAAQDRHVAGFDFTPGSTNQMIAQCKRLMAAVKGGRLDEVREFYGNVDGDHVVDGWDNLRDRAATSDASHLWHWHISFDRRQLTNRGLMERIVRIALGLSEPTVEVPVTQPAHQKVELVDATNNALAETWAASVALRDGRPVGKAGNHPGGPHALTTAVAALTASLTEVKTMLAGLAQTPPGTVTIDDEQLESVIRRVLGSLDGASPPGA